MRFKIWDTTEGRYVNEEEVNDGYGTIEGPIWYDNFPNACDMKERLVKETGHSFTIRRY